MLNIVVSCYIVRVSVGHILGSYSGLVLNQTKGYETSICCYSAKHIHLRNTSKYCPNGIREYMGSSPVFCVVRVALRFGVLC